MQGLMIGLQRFGRQRLLTVETRGHTFVWTYNADELQRALASASRCGGDSESELTYTELAIITEQMRNFENQTGGRRGDICEIV